MNPIVRATSCAGIKSVEVASVSQRLPVQPKPAAAGAQWVSWHLDRIDQRTLPLDGRYTSNATGTGVNM